MIIGTSLLKNETYFNWILAEIVNGLITGQRILLRKSFPRESTFTSLPLSVRCAVRCAQCALCTVHAVHCVRAVHCARCAWCKQLQRLLVTVRSSLPHRLSDCWLKLFLTKSITQVITNNHRMIGNIFSPQFPSSESTCRKCFWLHYSRTTGTPPVETKFRSEQNLYPVSHAGYQIWGNIQPIVVPPNNSKKKK